MNIVNEIKIKTKEHRQNNDFIKDLKKDYLDKIKELEKPLLNYLGGNEFKLLETEFPDGKWKYLTEKCMST